MKDNKNKNPEKQIDKINAGLETDLSIRGNEKCSRRATFDNVPPADKDSKDKNALM